jgi:hypothetical protein
MRNDIAQHDLMGLDADRRAREAEKDRRQGILLQSLPALLSFEQDVAYPRTVEVKMSDGWTYCLTEYGEPELRGENAFAVTVYRPGYHEVGELHDSGGRGRTAEEAMRNFFVE